MSWVHSSTEATRLQPALSRKRACRFVLKPEVVLRCLVSRACFDLEGGTWMQTGGGLWVPERSEVAFPSCPVTCQQPSVDRRRSADPWTPEPVAAAVMLPECCVPVEVVQCWAHGGLLLTLTPPRPTAHRHYWRHSGSASAPASSSSLTWGYVVPAT